MASRRIELSILRHAVLELLEHAPDDSPYLNHDQLLANLDDLKKTEKTLPEIPRDLRTLLRRLQNERKIVGVPRRGYCATSKADSEVLQHKGLQPQQTLVGFVFRDWSRTYFSNAAKGIGDFIRETQSDNTWLIVHRPQTVAEEVSTLKKLAEQCQGIILGTQASAVYDQLAELVQKKYPIVLVDREIEGANIAKVMLGNKGAGKMAASHFVDKLSFPANRLLVFCEHPDGTAATDRAQGFSTAIWTRVGNSKGLSSSVKELSPDEFKNLHLGRAWNGKKFLPCLTKSRVHWDDELIQNIAAFRRCILLPDEYICPIVIMANQEDEKGGRDLGENVLPELVLHFKATERKPLGLFAINDWVAAGIYESQVTANSSQSFSIGKNVHVIGVDGFSQFGLIPPLVSVIQNPRLQGTEAARILFQLIENRNSTDSRGELSWHESDVEVKPRIDTMGILSANSYPPSQ